MTLHRAESSATRLEGGPHTRLVYRSRATQAMSHADFATLTQRARRRNTQLGISGLLVVDGDRFVQWIEGPDDAVQAVWRSIQRDARHQQIERMAVPPGDERLFARWRMRLASGSSVADAGPTWLLQRAVLDRLQGGPALAVRTLRGLGDAACWPDTETLAQTLLSPSEPGAAFMRRAVAVDAAALDAIESTVFDPVNHLLGQWWSEDRCGAADLVIAQTRLMAWAHRWMSLPPPPSALGRRVLVAPLPHETHLAGVTLAACAHERAGATVSVVFARDVDALCSALHSSRFDLLQLCSSESLARRRSSRAVADLIAQARRASAEPCLAVLLRGRIFTEQPGLGVVLGADDSYAAGAMDDAALASLLQWCRRRGQSTAAMAAQATLMEVARHVGEQRFKR
jgi:Sensors of blue-light using FAD